MPYSSIRSSDIRVFSLNIPGLSRTVLDIPRERIVVAHLEILFYSAECYGSLYLCPATGNDT